MLKITKIEIKTCTSETSHNLTSAATFPGDNLVLGQDNRPCIRRNALLKEEYLLVDLTNQFPITHLVIFSFSQYL